MFWEHEEGFDSHTFYQYFELRENLIHTFDYKLIEEKYELTGRNDLCQYYFAK